VDNSTELWVPPGQQSESCILPPLPKSMYEHTANIVGENILVCFGHFCYRLAENGWVEGAALLAFRQYHTAAVTPRGLLLVGGYRVKTTRHFFLLRREKGHPSKVEL